MNRGSSNSSLLTAGLVHFCKFSLHPHPSTTERVPKLPGERAGSIRGTGSPCSHRSPRRTWNSSPLEPQLNTRHPARPLTCKESRRMQKRRQRSWAVAQWR